MVLVKYLFKFDLIFLRGVQTECSSPVTSTRNQLLYVINGYSIPEFTTIRRILVSNLVSNAGKKLNQHSNSSLSRHPMRGPVGVYG